LKKSALPKSSFHPPRGITKFGLCKKVVAAGGNAIAIQKPTRRNPKNLFPSPMGDKAKGYFKIYFGAGASDTVVEIVKLKCRY